MKPFEQFLFGTLDLRAAVSVATWENVDYPLDWQGEGETYQAHNDLGDWRLAVRPCQQGYTLHISVTLKEEPKHLRVSLLKVSQLEADRLVVGGIAMNAARSIGVADSVDNAWEGFHTTSITRDARTLLVSSPLKLQHQARVLGVANAGSTSLDIGYDLIHCGGTDIDFDPITLAFGDGLQLLKDYGDANIEVQRDFSATPECGWNSWDYYRWYISEEEVLKNAEFIARDPVLSKHVKRIIIDDGWQYCYGEWEANHRFPSGMKHVADEIRRLGFKPGLWLAPSVVEPHAAITYRDYDMLAQSEGGQPCLAFECMRRFGFILDPTVPKAQRHLRDLFDRYASYGFAYFKLDFLKNTLLAPRFADRSVGRSNILRKLMEPIVAGVAGRAEILGCNYPFTSGNSYISAVRVGADIHARWGNIRNNSVAVGSRFWAGKRLWLNDPDFALCRGPETSDDPELTTLKPELPFVSASSSFEPRRYISLSEASRCELEVLLSISLMAGGAINLSDNMPRLNESGLDLARRTVTAESGLPGEPLDLFTAELPSLWRQQLPSGKKRALLINWSDDTQVRLIPWTQLGGKPQQTTNFWNGETKPAADEIELKPHSCALLEYL